MTLESLKVDNLMQCPKLLGLSFTDEYLLLRREMKFQLTPGLPLRRVEIGVQLIEAFGSRGGGGGDEGREGGRGDGCGSATDTGDD